MSEPIELTGSTGVLHTYTSGNKGSKITMKIRMRPQIEHDVYLEFKEPDGVEVYSVNGAIRDNEKWKLLRTSYGYVREVTFWFRRSSRRDIIKEQEITVCVLSDSDEIIDDITFKIEG